MALRSKADLRLLIGILQVSSVFLPLVPICDFVFMNICSTICCLVVLLVDFPEDYC